MAYNNNNQTSAAQGPTDYSDNESGEIQNNTSIISNLESQQSVAINADSEAYFNVDTLELPALNFKTIDKTFGRPDDFVELHIYNTNEQLIHTEENFTDYEIPEGQSCFPLSKFLRVNPEKILTDRGYIAGQFKIQINIFKNKIFNTEAQPFSIKEISSDRREIKAISSVATNAVFDPAVSEFITDIESSVYFKEFSINLGSNIIVTCINVLLDKEPLKHVLLLKTYKPLPFTIVPNTHFKVVEEITDPIMIEVDLGDPQLVDNTIPLRGPNYFINTNTFNQTPTDLKNYNNLLEYNVTSSHQHLLSKLEDDGVDLNIQYDYIRPISESLGEVITPYHFENFTHFSSANKRLRNFHYKIKQIEGYDTKIKEVNTITGPTSASFTTLKYKKELNTKKENVIKALDGYEQFLFFTSGSDYTWPKKNTIAPHILYSYSSSQVINWLGDERSTYPKYGGQLLSSSLFDKANDHALSKLIPTHILENDQNNLYVSFINMIGHQFDNVWVYLKSITDIHNGSNTKGISEDLVYYQLKSLGFEAFDKFEDAKLLEYILGYGSGSNFYDVENYYSSSGIPSETMITASNEGSIPKGGIAKEIWKRLYHNAPYLLKTKGLAGGNNTTEYSIKIPWSSSLTNNLSASAKTVEFRVKPTRLEGDADQHLFVISGALAGTYQPQLTINTHTGGDVLTYGDANQYGTLRLDFGTSSIETPSFPIYNGDFWNIFIGASESGSGALNNFIKFGAYQSNWLKNVSYYTGSLPFGTEAARAISFGDEKTPHGSFRGGGQTVYIGGRPDGHNTQNDHDQLFFSGSIQEVNFHFGELLSHSTLKKHALEPSMYAGNTPSSSFNNVVVRLPLGSNDQKDSSSFHPNIDVNYLGGATSSMTVQTWGEVIEDHYMPTPDTVGISMTSEKVRIDEGTTNGDVLSPFIKTETSTLDRQPQDFEDLGIFLSPTTEINEDIIYTLGAFRLDDYIGSPLPSAQSSSTYGDLKNIKDIYFQKVKRNRYRYGDFIKQIEYIDHTLFKMVEQFVPFKANLKTGILIEPHYLERSKFNRTLPSTFDGTTMVLGSHQTIETVITQKNIYRVCSGSEAFGTAKNIRDQWDPGSYVTYHSNLAPTTSSKGKRIEQGTNTTIEVFDDYLDPAGKDPNRENAHASQAPIKPFTTTKPTNYIAHQSSVLLGNMIGGRKSNKYYKYKEYYLQTSQSVTHSFGDRQLTAEFDDALVDQLAWKNSRYNGARLTGKEINAYHVGDITYQNKPIITKTTTALYIANTVIGGQEDPQFATLKGHSYVGISKILIVDTETQTVQVLDNTAEPYDEFHRFITNDFPTGNKAYLKVIDNSIQTNLKGHHRVRMNKGFLLKTFAFNNAGETSGSMGGRTELGDNNSMYLYKKGEFKDNFIDGAATASSTVGFDGKIQGNQLRFRYSVMEMFESNVAGTGPRFSTKHIGPNFASSSIHENKFTQLYYTGSYGFVKHRNIDSTSTNTATIINATAMASASRFIGIDTLAHLKQNIDDTTLTNQQKTEVHVTFFQGTKDFAPGWHDERSISTFEVDQNQAVLGVEQGTVCNASLPTNHELILKGPNDNRFLPTLSTFNDDIQNAHLIASGGACIASNAALKNSLAAQDFMQSGITIDKIEDAQVYVQGGILGFVGYESAQSSSIGSYGNSQLDNMSSEHHYSGSFNYELSFLDKDHTLILDLDKNAELMWGIGNHGLVIIPEDTHTEVAFNIDFYLQQAGLITTGPVSPVNFTPTN